MALITHVRNVQEQRFKDKIVEKGFVLDPKSTCAIHMYRKKISDDYEQIIAFYEKDYSYSDGYKYGPSFIPDDYMTISQRFVLDNGTYFSWTQKGISKKTKGEKKVVGCLDIKKYFDL